ncbi:hypothetical protein K488DRAFT_87989 [Vararia minispora EC-137]|uniref:Uncharacterized protein n=1 Tax=Vararia minispora EC-137 TaxID=1314806 RepID=A0ACB8QEG4_9AGAM|nr:hypothetical protein K488DRAFT_87989 [Vararia minispora EC-137]
MQARPPEAQMARFALSIEGFVHKTTWVDLLDIAAEAKKISTQSTRVRDGEPLHTVPFIYDPATRRVIYDSWNVVVYLKEQYSAAPRLFPPRTCALQASKGASSARLRC